MADDPRWFRERAAIERATAADTGLANVRERALRAAERWDELADRVERVQAASAERNGKRSERSLGTAS